MVAVLPRTFLLLSFRRGLSCMAFQQQGSNTATAAELNILNYLDSVEAEIRCQEPVMTKRITDPNRKPMIRTLLGIDSKYEFDALVRAAKKDMEFQRLEIFARDHLSPAIARDDDRWIQVPYLPNIISEALKQPRSSGAGAFHKLGAGRTYRGDTSAMVQDLFPEILQQYLDATAELEQMEILAGVIQSRINTVDDERFDAAMRCLNEFPMKDDSMSSSSNGNDDQGDEAICPKVSGKNCERSCIEYLTSQFAAGEILISNVYVNHKSALSRPKYNNSNPFQRHDPASGVIWTSIGRANQCSEFDAVLYTKEYTEDGDEDSARIDEIWEAKLSISPSSLWDAVTKKISSLREIMSDEEAYLTHEGTQLQLRFPNAEEGKLIFGIYGKEILSPENAIGQMVSMASTNGLKDIKTVVKALDRGYVEVKRSKTLSDLDCLRRELLKVEKDFNINLRIGH